MVDLEEEVSSDDLSFAEYQLGHIRKRLADVKQDLYIRDDFDNPHDISPEDIKEDAIVAVPHATITDCQIIIELSAKTIFKSLGVNPVEKHDMEFSNERVSGALGRVPDTGELPERVPRVVFLTQFWERFYTISKYGVPEENISSFEIMNESDGLRAVQDADFCAEVADNVHSYVMDVKGLEREDLDADLMRHI